MRAYWTRFRRRKAAASGTEVLHAFLRQQPGLHVRPDAVYGKVFEFPFVACCIPLGVLVWFNPDSKGFFLRIVFPPLGSFPDPDATLRVLNQINYDLPIGSFAADPARGEVRFKSTVFVEELGLYEHLLQGLLGSSFEMVRTHHPAVLQAMTGQQHAH